MNVIHITPRVVTRNPGAHIPHERDVTAIPSEQHAQARFTTAARRIHVKSTPRDSACENASPCVVPSSCAYQGRPLRQSCSAKRAGSRCR